MRMVHEINRVIIDRWRAMDSRVLLILVAGAMSFIKLWLVGGQILQALGTYLYDDMLFISHAKSILGGDWLGAYNERTLIKGAIYPLWIAMISGLGAPLLAAQHVFYIVACAVFVWAVRPLMPAPGLLLVLYLVLLFNPMSFSEEVSARVLRDGIYPALTILVLSGAVGFLARVNTSLKVLLRWSVVLGVTLSIFLLTREEGIWLLPGIVLLMGLSAWRIWAVGMGWKGLCICVLPVAIWLIADGAMASVNRLYYGITETVDLQAPGYRAAYGALTRIKAKDFHPTIPVPEDVREQAYAASPAFAQLRPFLDGDRGEGWKGRGWRFEGRFSYWDWGDESFDIHRGPFQWALRDSAALAGHYASAKGAESFYWQIAREINEACQNGMLECGPERASTMPQWHTAYGGPLLRTYFHALEYFIRFEDFTPTPNLSRGPQSALDTFSDVTHEQLFLVARDQLNLRGWVFSPSQYIDLAVVQENGAPAPAVIRRGHSPHVYQRFLDRGMDIPEAREARFELTTPCRSGCYLEFSGGGRRIGRAPLHTGMGSSFSGQVYFGVDAVDLGTTGPSPSRANTMQLRLDILGLIGMAYQYAMPVLTVLALMVYVLLSVLLYRQRWLFGLWVVLTALLGSAVARVLIVSVLDLLSFPAIRVLYLASGYPVLLMFVSVALMIAGSMFRQHSNDLVSKAMW